MNHIDPRSETFGNCQLYNEQNPLSTYSKSLSNYSISSVSKKSRKDPNSHILIQDHEEDIMDSDR